MAKKTNFFKLPYEEQRAIMASALHNADMEQQDALRKNSDKVMAAKYELINLLNEILNQDYTANDRIVFTQTENGEIEVSRE